MTFWMQAPILLCPAQPYTDTHRDQVRVCGELTQIAKSFSRIFETT